MAPDEAERVRVAAPIGLPAPTRADRQEIEHSARLSPVAGAPVMTAQLPPGQDGERPRLEPVSVVLARDRLVTLRHHTPCPVEQFPGRAGQDPVVGRSGRWRPRWRRARSSGAKGWFRWR